jgi:hypothetical protein
MKLLAETTLPVVSETRQFQPLRRARASVVRIRRSEGETLQDADPAKISGIAHTRRWHDAGEGNWCHLAIGQPPMSAVKRRDGRAAEEGQTMQLGQGIRDCIIPSVHLANPVGCAHDLRHRFARSISLAEKPLARAQASAAASPYSVTARFTTQQGMASAGDDAISDMSSHTKGIIC